MSFVISKIFWTGAAPANFLVLTLFAASCVGLWARPLWRVRAQRTVFVIASLLVLFILLPLGTWALLPLENANPMQLPQKIDGIILLGGDENAFLSEIWGQPILGVSASRHVRFAALAQKYPEARLIFTGGIGWVNDRAQGSNGPIVREALTSLGVPSDRLLIEDRSRNTFENALFSKEMAKPKADENWLLVTSAFHMPRSLGCFRKAGWNVFPAPTDYHTPGGLRIASHLDVMDQLYAMTLAIHEYIGLAAYRLMGRTDSLWP